jgi:CheY-like chemotaxis protein
VAHDFNNLLTPILSYAELLQTDLGDDHPAAGPLSEIRKAGETAASVTRQLLAFGRRQTLQARKLNLNTFATKMGNLLRRLIGSQFQLELVLEPEVGWVEADPSQLEQVIMNLVLNARDAVPKGGIIAVETANVNLHGEKTCWCGLPLQGSFVVLAVTDDGAGMDEQTRARVFEPFFTTKERGRGTGLGLATVYGIVTQSNGRLRVESALGQGTTFEVYLPRVEPPRESVAPRPAAAGIPARQGTILLVEDDEPVLRLFRDVLAANGYRVLVARDGEEALASAQSFPRPIDLLVSDLVMPKMNGLELHQKLTALRPGLKTIFMSGHAAGIVGLESTLDESTVFLAKPFTPSELLRKVGRLLPDRNRAKAS